jgi:hypothetical protein
MYVLGCSLAIDDEKKIVKLFWAYPLKMCVCIYKLITKNVEAIKQG